MNRGLLVTAVQRRGLTHRHHHRQYLAVDFTKETHRKYQGDLFATSTYKPWQQANNRIPGSSAYFIVMLLLLYSD
jgi:hypothetical protein